MEVVVDLSGGRVLIEYRDEFGLFSLHVRRGHPDNGDADGALGALAEALSLHDAGTVDLTGDVLVSPAAVRRLATEVALEEGRPLDPGWEAGFGGMLEYAAGKGWIADDGAVRAHVEWGE
ncbi:MAG: hypothetical protein ACLPR9_08865 [Acidimicrobiales bacterium]|jgi:hypothetical protein